MRETRWKEHDDGEESKSRRLLSNIAWSQATREQPWNSMIYHPRGQIWETDENWSGQYVKNEHSVAIRGRWAFTGKCFHKFNSRNGRTFTRWRVCTKISPWRDLPAGSVWVMQVPYAEEEAHFRFYATDYNFAVTSFVPYHGALKSIAWYPPFTVVWDETKPQMCLNLETTWAHCWNGRSVLNDMQVSGSGRSFGVDNLEESESEQDGFDLKYKGIIVGVGGALLLLTIVVIVYLIRKFQICKKSNVTDQGAEDIEMEIEQEEEEQPLHEVALAVKEQD